MSALAMPQVELSPTEIQHLASLVRAHLRKRAKQAQQPRREARRGGVVRAGRRDAEAALQARGQVLLRKLQTAAGPPADGDVPRSVRGWRD